MSEHIPTLSSELAEVSKQRDILEEIPVAEHPDTYLEAQAAGYAAKPFMDVAVASLEAAKGTGLDAELAKDHAGLPNLIDYAERRMRSAVARGEARDVTDDEKVVLEVYKAEAERDNVIAEFGEDYDKMEIKDIIAAAAEAGDRRAQASPEDRETKRKWGELERKLERYAAYLSGSDGGLSSEFSTTSERAGGLLSISDAEAGAMDWSGAVKKPQELLLDAHNLHSEAAMLRFVKDHMKFEKQRALINKINIRSSAQPEVAVGKRGTGTAEKTNEVLLG